jgi:DNA-binding transcriptional MerR regulator
MTIDRVTGPLTVGQLAARAGVRADTIRYYERAGLLPEPSRTDGDHRRYGAADVDRMLFIRGAQRLGLRLSEIRELLVVRETGDCPCGPAETLLRQHIGEIDREIDRLTRLRAELSGMVAGLSGLSGSSGPCPDPVPGTWCAADRQDTASNAGGGDRNVLVLR